MNEHTLPHPSSPQAPKYWMYEQGDELKPAIVAYMNGERLTARQVAFIRAYLRQWIDSPAWDMNPALDNEGRAELAVMRDRVRRIASESDISRSVSMMTTAGMDPL